MGDDTVPDDGVPLRYGDCITLYAKQNVPPAFVCGDGFNMQSLMFKTQAEGDWDTRCLFKICPKLSYQAQKRYKKILGTIGIKKYDELESFKKEEDVVQAEVDELEKLRVGGGPLDKENQENEEEEQASLGKPLTYGTEIQLLHLNSAKWVTLSKGAGLQPGSLAVETTAEGGEGAWWKILPGYKVRKEGDAVVVTDQIMLASAKKSTPDNMLYFHTYNEDGWTDEENHGELRTQYGEINGMVNVRTRYEILRYKAFDQGIGYLCSGDIIRLAHKEEEGFLSLGQVGGYQAKKDLRPIVKIHIMNRERAVGAYTCSNSLWRLEQMNVRSIDDLLARRSQGLATQREKGGNCT
eukprot:SAG11_NODE_6155_length_1375_cov_1.363636_1_plen_351_part_01